MFFVPEHLCSRSLPTRLPDHTAELQSGASPGDPPTSHLASIPLPICFFSTTGEWRIENEGVSPDVEIDLEPDAVNRGVDTQLDAGIAEVMRQLEDYQAIKQIEAPPLPTVLGQ